MKTCKKCTNTFELSFFNKDKNYKDGLSCYCKNCTRNFVKNCKSDRSEYYKQWYISNKERLAQHGKNYFAKNKCKINLRDKKRRQKDSFYKLKRILSCRTRSAFKQKGYSKRSKSKDLLGESFDIIMKYIENKFKEGMNWENHGKWHIDHIIPLDSAKTEEELYKLCHYTNLQPLWASENLSKGNRIIN